MLEKNTVVQPAFRRVKLSIIPQWLKLGWEHFRRTAMISVLFSSIFASIGLVGMALLIDWGFAPMIYPWVSGFLLIGPALLAGFFYVSELLANGQTPRFSNLFAGFRSSPGSLWLLSAIILLLFVVWLADAIILYAMFFGTEPVFLSPDLLKSPLFNDHLLPFLVAGSLMGSALAFAIYAISAFSVPLMFDRQFSFAPAIIASLRAIFGNFLVMLAWGLILTVTMLVTIPVPPLFVVAFPVLAYASYQAYKSIWPFYEEENWKA